jgi:chemotaxis protein MotB
MVTLLMVFFILLFSMSTLEVDRFQAFVDSFRRDTPQQFEGGESILDGAGGASLLDNPPIPTPPPPVVVDDPTGGYAAVPPETIGDVLARMENSFRTYQAQFIPDPDTGLITGTGTGADAGVGTDTGVAYDAEGAYHRWPIMEVHENYLLFISHDMHFNSGQSALLPQAQSILDMLAPILLEFTLEGHRIEVQGHTDSVPQVSPPYRTNRHLSAARASTVTEHLIRHWGIDPRLITAVGQGEYWPIDTNETPAGRANNRRVEIRVFAHLVVAAGDITTYTDFIASDAAMDMDGAYVSVNGIADNGVGDDTDFYVPLD